MKATWTCGARSTHKKGIQHLYRKSIWEIWGSPKKNISKVNKVQCENVEQINLPQDTIHWRALVYIGPLKAWKFLAN
jgi:hypothetical protein